MRVALIIPVLVVFAIGFANYLDIPLVGGVEYMFASFDQDDADSKKGNDDTVMESMIKRNTELPGKSLDDLYRTNGFLGYVFGGTLAQMGTATMKEGEVPFDMPHNSFVDFLLIGGIPQFCIFLAMLGISYKYIRELAICSSTNTIRARVFRTLQGFFVIFVINMFFASSMTMHPNLSSIFWLSIGYIASQKEKIREQAVISS